MREVKRQLSGALIVIMTIAAVIAAGINFQQQRKFQLPEDGVTWVDREAVAGTNPNGAPIRKNTVVALHVSPDSPAAKAGIVQGDILHSISNLPVTHAVEVAEILVGIGVWKKAEYIIEHPYTRDGAALALEVKYTVNIAERAPSDAVYYQYFVGVAYLFVGLFVFFRRGDAHKALHFYLLCLASFVLYTFHYTGKLNSFDQVIYFGNVFAGLLMPVLFIHFALVFPDTPIWLRRRSWLLYVPSLAICAAWAGIVSGYIRVAVSPVELRWLFDRGWLAFVAGGQLIGAGILAWRHRNAADAVVRQQIKWLRNGAVFGVLPFAVMYVMPYLMGAVLGPEMEMAVLPLALVPLTWAYAIFRYRLMDVDIIFQQGYVYTLATLAVLAVFYGLVFSITSSIPHPEGQPGARVDDLNPAALVSLILIAAFIFQPVRNWLQEVLDRHFFYKDRYDYRRTLIEFARELGSETDLNRTLNTVADRLIRTLSIDRLAFFLNDEKSEQDTYRLYLTAGRQKPAPDLIDLSFLDGKAGESLFFERTRGPYDALLRDWPQPGLHTIADLDLTYYLPCTARGRVIAYLGVSRTTEGDFLSSDDVELLQTLCGYVGISIENARLYRSLQRKADEYERLKEFSENIVESINVGIAAADFEDRIESWNSQMESMTGITRQDAVGRRLLDLLPAELTERLDTLRGEAGIHTIYKFPLPGPADADRVINIVLAPLVSRDQEQIGRLILFDDITERSVLEQRLMQADKLSSLGLLAAGVAHEVNTPLAVISTYAQLLSKQVNGDDSKAKLLEKIAKQTFRASEIVNSLLNFSRTSSTAYEEIDLNRVVRETLQLIQPQLVKARIEVDEHLAAGLGAVRGNAGKLQQVFLNLLLNARDAMEGGGRLTVISESNDAQATITIIDTGCGIPDENLARIYDPFFTTKGAKKGTGLGLSITYGIVKEHGGSIAVQSQPGSGTRFQLDFPVVRKTVNA
ncbi:MAG: PAS domain S-box protein [Acidobacteria bacterium]|nr:PAS domain S-box protein [Acidobacteriota bacterium]